MNSDLVCNNVFLNRHLSEVKVFHALADAVRRSRYFMLLLTQVFHALADAVCTQQLKLRKLAITLSCWDVIYLLISPVCSQLPR